MAQCEWKIRPFPNDTEVECEKGLGHEDGDPQHSGVLRDYAYPGSVTTISWMHDDRRNFCGQWLPCHMTGCTLPLNHPRDHNFT